MSGDDLTVHAYLHQHFGGYVSTDPRAYENPRRLVALNDVADRIDYLEKGLAEWRAIALAGIALAKDVDAHGKGAIGRAPWNAVLAKAADLASSS